MRHLMPICLCFFLLLANADHIQAEDGPYLYELLDKPAYLQRWNAMMQHEKNVPQWLALFAGTKNGPCTPSWTEQIQGKHVRIAAVCKSHDCGDNRFYVLFPEQGGQALGLLRESGKPERFFGAPDARQQELLRASRRHE